MPVKSKRRYLSNTLLIVDDIEVNRMILANIFEENYDILEAENGAEGLEKLHKFKNRICGILLDIVMPVMDGMEMLAKMKEEDILEDIPVFIITAESRDTVVKEAYAMGVMDIILKPVIPFIVERRVNSVVELYQARKELSGELAKQQFKVMEQMRHISELSIGMIESLSMAIEFRSGESGEHVQRIRDITKVLLQDTIMGEGLDEDTIDQISLGAVMHDVGKISIPDEILNKPGRLTPEEFEIMKTHTVRGAELLEAIPQMKDNRAYAYAYDIALHHHEKWDGRGYPEGLKGDEISKWAQVVSIADVYDALVNDRCYKKAFSYDKAVEMIVGGECGAFSPILLDAFLSEEPKLRALYTELKKKK